MEGKIKDLVSGVITENGYILSNVVYEKEGNTNFLRIIIEKDGYITVDDCVTVCNLVNPILDKEDPIEENYILDVCSKESGEENE